MNIEGLTENTGKTGSVYYENAAGEVVAKECSKCHSVKLREEFRKQSAGLGGCISYCKKCEAEYKRKRDEAKRVNQTHVRKRPKLEEREGILGKTCGSCGVWKPLDGYYKGKALGGKISKCKMCKVVEGRSWRSANPEYDRDYYSENKERYAEVGKKWRSNNRDKRVLYDQRREARRIGLPDTLTEEEYALTLEYFGNACAITGELVENSEIHRDHVIPISVGHGGTVYGNIIPLRGDLNVSKNDRNIFEWFEANRQRFNLEQEKFDRLIDWLGKANDMTVEEYRQYVYWCHDNPQETSA